MANRERGELRLVAQGRSYTLRLTAGACCELQDLSGQTLAAVIASVNRGSARDTRWLLWASMQARHASTVPHVEDAGRLADRAGGLLTIVPVLAEFMALNTDDASGRGDDDDQSASADRSGSQWRRLYLDARRVGMDPDTFWSLSLKELWLELAAARERQKDERERDVTMAWWTANLSKASRMPQLSTLLGRQERRARSKPSQTWQEMKAALKTLTT